MLREEQKQRFVLNAMDCRKGDDLERAKAAFRGRSEAEMQGQYGQSGQTRQQILDGYQRDRDEWEESMAWIKELMGVSTC